MACFASSAGSTMRTAVCTSRAPRVRFLFARTIDAASVAMRSITSFTYEFTILIVRLDIDIWLLIALRERLMYTFHERFGLRCDLRAALAGAERGVAMIAKVGRRGKEEKRRCERQALNSKKKQWSVNG